MTPAIALAATVWMVSMPCDGVRSGGFDAAAGWVVTERCQVGWADPTEAGRNAAGDLYCTDGALGIAVLQRAVPGLRGAEEVEAR